MLTNNIRRCDDLHHAAPVFPCESFMKRLCRINICLFAKTKALVTLIVGSSYIWLYCRFICPVLSFFLVLLVFRFWFKQTAVRAWCDVTQWMLPDSKRHRGCSLGRLSRSPVCIVTACNGAQKPLRLDWEKGAPWLIMYTSFLNRSSHSNLLDSTKK